MQEKYWFLKNSQLFNQLGDADLSWLESRSRLRSFPRNSPIYLPADHADGVLLLVSGRVKICSVTPEGKQSILAFIEPGEMFGELSILDHGSREEYAEASEKSTVVLIPVEYMRELVERNSHLALSVTKLLGLRRKRVERRLKYLLFRSNRDRLIHLLLELAEDYGKQNGARIDLSIKLSHQDLASVIGSTRETADRHLRTVTVRRDDQSRQTPNLVGKPQRSGRQCSRCPTESKATGDTTTAIGWKAKRLWLDRVLRSRTMPSQAVRMHWDFVIDGLGDHRTT